MVRMRVAIDERPPVLLGALFQRKAERRLQRYADLAPLVIVSLRCDVDLAHDQPPTVVVLQPHGEAKQYRPAFQMRMLQISAAVAKKRPTKRQAHHRN